MNEVPVRVGDVLAGKYRVEKVLGAGAMGVVVAARHVDLHELRAIKFMLPGALGDAEGLERFLREARAAVRLRSQHVAKVQDFGRLDTGAPYIVMEYLEGGDLKGLLDSRGTLPVAEAVGYMLQACEAVAEAHSVGIIHRDLKPANLFLTTVAGKPCVKVLDFGIAKVAESAGGGEMTGTTMLLGTPLFMSPEQMRSSKAVDARSDVWALGVILYRMFTGKVPFSGNSVTEICSAVLTDIPEVPSLSRPDLPRPLEAIVLRCLEKNPAQRFQSVHELAAALAPFATAGASAAVTTAAPVNHPAAVSATAATEYAARAAGATFVMANQPVSAPASTMQASSAIPPTMHAPHGAQAAPQAPYGAQATGGHVAAATGYGVQAAHAGAQNYGVAPYPNQAGYSQSIGMAPPGPVAAPSSSRAGWIVAAVVTVLAIVGGVGMFVAFSKSSESARPTGASPEQTQAPTSVAAAAPTPTPTPTSTDTGQAQVRNPTGATQAPRPGPAVANPTSANAGTSNAAPAANTAAQPAQGAISSSGSTAVAGIAIGCWKGNEGAEKGQAASSASIQVTAGPPRSVLVTGPAKAKKSFTACVVTRCSSLPLQPGEIAQSTVNLPAGPS